MTDDATLSAFRLSDSFLPVGTYAVSYGLEQFVEDGRVADAAALETLLTTYLRAQVGPADLVALRAALDAAGVDDLEAVCAADRRLTAVTLAAELRESARRSGDRLLSLERELRDDDLLERYAARVRSRETPGNYVVVLGLVTASTGVDARTTCLLYCHGFVTGLLGVAQRLLPLGHTDVQRVLRDLRPVMVEAVEDGTDRSVDAMAPFAPLVDVLSADHERADRRLFSS
jgi:urease accessory protein